MAAPLDHVLSQLLECGVIPQAVRALESSAQTAGTEFREAVLAEIPAFRSSGNPGILPELGRHASQHIEEVMRLFRGGEIGRFDFVKDHARHRAEQHFPLEATLHAYRCGHRIVSHWLRDAAIAANPSSLELAVSAVADFAIEYTNTISTIMTSEYVAHMRALAETEGDRRMELLTILLKGYDESDGRVTQLLKRAGYLEQRQSYCVVAAQAAQAAEMESLPRTQRIIGALSDAVAQSSIRMLAGLRNNLAIAVLSDRRRLSGWTAPQAALAERIQPLLQVLGPSVLVGISADHPSTSFVPTALNEATIALDFASVANRVVTFSDLPLRGLLVHRGSAYVRSAAPAWAQKLAESDPALIETLRAMADADMNVQQAARLLARHPNTVYARLERIKELTGLDGQRYHHLTELLLAAECWRR